MITRSISLGSFQAIRAFFRSSYDFGSFSMLCLPVTFLIPFFAWKLEDPYVIIFGKMTGDIILSQYLSILESLVWSLEALIYSSATFNSSIFGQ